MKLRTVKHLWDDYLKHVVPEGAHKNQIIETRRAFYAAFFSALEIFKKIGGPEISEDEGVQHLCNLIEEVRQFAATVGTENEGE